MTRIPPTTFRPPPDGTVFAVRVRNVNPAVDLQTLHALFELITVCDGHSPIGEHKYLDLIATTDRTARDLIFEDGSGGSADGPIAYVIVKPTDGGDTWAMELAVHPLHRTQEVLAGVVSAGLETARSGGARRVRAWAFSTPVVSALRPAGFEPERELRQLRRSLPISDCPTFPKEVTVGPFRPGVDDDEWLAVNNSAFASHPENGAWTAAILEDRFRQPWFLADGFRMARDGDDLVAFCWTKLHGADLGEIYVVAVAPDHQGRGLGRAMVLEGLRWMAEAGAAEAMLYVDADNHAGLALYERLGFELDHVDRSFVIDLKRDA